MGDVPFKGFLDPLDDQFALMRWRVRNHDSILHDRDGSDICRRIVEDKMKKTRKLGYRMSNSDALERSPVASKPEHVLACRISVKKIK